mmetsp:Transcript_57964/g.102931  ORF Transcript_57964/g.102931 Transcript_57964/m.102931 type:complete len:214 (+) Transcript_57964:1213-1854(+)
MTSGSSRPQVSGKSSITSSGSSPPRGGSSPISCAASWTDAEKSGRAKSWIWCGGCALAFEASKTAGLSTGDCSSAGCISMALSPSSKRPLTAPSLYTVASAQLPILRERKVRDLAVSRNSIPVSVCADTSAPALYTLTEDKLNMCFFPPCSNEIEADCPSADNDTFTQRGVTVTSDSRPLFFLNVTISKRDEPLPKATPVVIQDRVEASPINQ